MAPPPVQGAPSGRRAEMPLFTKGSCFSPSPVWAARRRLQKRLLRAGLCLPAGRAAAFFAFSRPALP